VYPDSTLKALNSSGVKIVEFPDKNKEILFPDGRVIKLDENKEIVDVSFGTGTFNK
jgi:hypothetical protein